MNKIYQPIVIQKAESIINFLEDINFFADFQITDYSFAKNHLCDILTEKYIEGKISMDFEDLFEDLFEDKEFEKCLKDIIVGCTFTELKSKGIVDSYEDDSTDEKFFLTEKGTEFLKDIKNKNGLI